MKEPNNIKPLYDNKDFEKFCQTEKERGLSKRYWKNLPNMWQEELKFRAEFENALKKFTRPSSSSG